MNSKNRSCSIPWQWMTNLELHTQKITPCCKIPFEPFTGELLTLRTQKIRQQFIDGEEPTECRACWDLEAHGGVSYRQRQGLNPIDYTQVTAADPIKLLQLTFSNQCQLRCSYCVPDHSSLWADHLGQSEKNITANLKLIPSNMLTGIEMIGITGGEPMISDEALNFMESLDNFTGILNIITNLSYGPKTTDRLIDILNRHPGSSVGVSLDNIGVNYSRRYHNWDLWSVNYQRLIDNLQTQFEIDSRAYVITIITINQFNYLKLTETIEYHLHLRKKGFKGIKFVLNYVDMSQPMSLASAPVDSDATIKIDPALTQYLLPKELNQINAFNQLINTINVDPTVQNKTISHLAQWDPDLLEILNNQVSKLT